MRRLQVGDIIRLKKAHPCGGDRWEVMRTGADIRIRCLGCSRLLLLPRTKVERSIKEIVTPAEP